jgi:diguanylate cyclase (GGDEF)-like protein
MRDPRLVEIDFLMDLETRGQLPVRSSISERGAFTSGVGPKGERYGVDLVTFRGLVLDLLMRDYVTGTKPLTDNPGGGGVDSGNFRSEREILITQLTGGNEIHVIISHAGRVRLWMLRDELLRNPDVEPMGLLSKAAWETDLFLRLRWASAEEPLAIVFFDLDNFGLVNKQLGSAVGDDVLRSAFGLVKNLVGSRGRVYRFGGEEVGVLLPNMTKDAARDLAEGIRAMVEANVCEQVPKLGRPQTASLGVATFVAGVDPRTALEVVDALMREAKQSGKNRVVVASD